MEQLSLRPLSPLFDGIRDEDGLRAWLMRVYFNPVKHSQEGYFRSTVSKENVLEYISNPGNKFPQTPTAISEVWYVLPSLREGLKSVSADEEAEKAGNYIKGEKTLAEIGLTIGHITAAMVNKISDQAVMKLTVMSKALNSDNKWLSREAEERIDNAVMNTANIFADAVMTSETVSDLLDRITQSKIVTWPDVSAVVDQTEKDAFQNLLDTKAEGATKEDFIDIFEEDLSKSVNVFNFAQLCVSRQVFPPGKRGRKKGTTVNAE